MTYAAHVQRGRVLSLYLSLDLLLRSICGASQEILSVPFDPLAALFKERLVAADINASPDVAVPIRLSG